MRQLPFLLATLAIACAAPACGGGSSSSASAAAAAPKVFVWKPQHGSALSIVHRTTDNLEHDPSGPRPDWVLFDPKGDQIVMVGSDAGYQRALKIAQAYDVAPPSIAQQQPPTTSSSLALNPLYAPPPPAPDPLDPAIADGVHKIDDDHYVLDRALIDKLLSNPMAVARGARVVPSIKNGAANGFKLYAIRPSSFYAWIGLANGDTIHTINGYDLTSPDKALEVYTQVKDAKNVDVGITRRGTEIVLHYSIK